MHKIQDLFTRYPPRYGDATKRITSSDVEDKEFFIRKNVINILSDL
ncbi:MAG: hypothetical protein GWN45_08145 [Gammaproteobacteria bacterium]|nr:hypothetical protein [Gammaproteobacteria bacterium]NIW10065.1 hypothetical protein [Gammaproteobacteria bacterium]